MTRASTLLLALFALAAGHAARADLALTSPHASATSDPGPVATFSILGFDPVTGELGGAVASRVFSVGNGVLWAEAGVGAVATQAWVDVRYGPQGLGLLRRGLAPGAVVEQLLDDDPDPYPERWPEAGRQFAVMDARGAYAAHTGPRADAWAGNRGGVFCTAQGNILAGEAVADAMVKAFETTGGHLSERLLAALEAGQEAGGDTRGRQSASMLIVKENGGAWLHNDVVLRLQVDDHAEPIAELRRLVEKAAVWNRRARFLAAPVPKRVPERATMSQIEEATIAELQAAFLSGALTSRELVDRYLARIEAYDRHGPALNALITINPRARERADELDRQLAETGELTGPLHGIPMIVKDNYDTHDLPTTAGSAALEGSLPPDDAFQVRKIRAAGAIVLAKSNMAEWAFSPYQTVGSALPGHTKNPYALDRVPAGSSGGTAAAVAANLGTVGLGTDTGNSIRGPSSHTSLVGIRSTMGLTSRDGIVPLYFDHDVGGPMARTVADAVAVLDVIAGPDPADPVTAASRDRRAARYADHLYPDGLRGKRIGVVRQLADGEEGDPDVRLRFEESLAHMRAAGAEIIDPVRVAWLDDTPPGERWCPRFRHDLEQYLASLGPEAPIKTLDDVIASGAFHPSVRSSLTYFRDKTDAPIDDPECQKAWAHGRKLGAEIRQRMESGKLDALVYPTWSNPPRKIGDLTTPAGDNSQDLSPHSGYPAITVPMGFVHGGLPVGLSILGTAWSEPTLIEIAYAYEQATQHRHPPASAPPLE